MARPVSESKTPLNLRIPESLNQLIQEEADRCELSRQDMAVVLIETALHRAPPAASPAKAQKPPPETIKTLKGGKAPALSPKPAGQPQRRAIEDVLRDQRASAELARRLFGKK